MRSRWSRSTAWLPADLLAKVQALPQVKQAKALVF